MPHAHANRPRIGRLTAIRGSDREPSGCVRDDVGERRPLAARALQVEARARRVRTQHFLASRKCPQRQWSPSIAQHKAESPAFEFGRFTPDRGAGQLEKQTG